MNHGPANTPTAGDNTPGSLGAAIETIVRWAGVGIDGDTLSAAMGWPWLLCTGEDHACPRTWHRLARDAFLIEAGHTLGLSLRGLHPPRAARGLDALVEFQQHFDASYKPLIRRALEHHQPIIIATPDATDRVSGPTWRAILPDPTADASALAQSTSNAPSPPTQVYVVERASPTAADFEHLLSVTLDHARRALSGEVDSGFGVVSGPKACDRWIRLLSEEKPCPACGQQIESCHGVLAGAIAGEHDRLIRFLDRHRDHVPAEACRLFETIETISRDVTGVLGEDEVLATIPEAVAVVANLRASLVRLVTALDARAPAASR